MRRTDRTPAAGLLFAAALVACGDPPRGERDIDSLPALVPTAEVRIGSTDDPDVGFSQLALADVDADGNVYALEALDLEIRAYDPAGRLLRRIGRPGSGPGEFQGAPRFGIHGDTLWTYDMDAGRITLFDRRGILLSTGLTRGARIPLDHQYGLLLPWRMRPDGLFISWLASVQYVRDDPPAVSGVVPVPRVVFNAAGEVVDTAGWTPGPPPRMVPPPEYGRDRFRSVTIGSRRRVVPDPPTDLPEWFGLADGHIVVDVPYTGSGDAGSFTVTKIGLGGDTVYHRTLHYRPVRFTSEDLDSAAAQGTRAFGGAGLPEHEAAVVRNGLRAELRFPEFKLPVRYAWLAQDDAVWLLRADPPGATARWIMLDSAGEVRGELQLPTRTRPLWTRGSVLWAAEFDAEDVPWLARFRIDS